jgi:site-specific recombinase XerD
MVRPVGRPMARKPITLEDLREEFLAHCESRNLSIRTLDWYDDRTRRFADWCATQGIDSPSDLRLPDLERFVLHCPSSGLCAQHRARLRAGPQDPVPAGPPVR